MRAISSTSQEGYHAVGRGQARRGTRRKSGTLPPADGVIGLRQVDEMALRPDEGGAFPSAPPTCARHGAVAAVQAFTADCRACGHKMSLPDRGGDPRGTSYAAPVSVQLPAAPALAHTAPDYASPVSTSGPLPGSTIRTRTASRAVVGGRCSMDGPARRHECEDRQGRRHQKGTTVPRTGPPPGGQPCPRSPRVRPPDCSRRRR